MPAPLSGTASRGSGVQDVADGRRFEELSRCVSKNPTERKNGASSWSAPGDQLGGRRRDLVAHLRREVEVDDKVVAEVVGLRRDVLLADQPGPVARLTQHVDDVPLGMGQPVAPVRQPEHPGRMGALAGEQGGPQPEADWRGAERLAKEDALIGEVLDVRRRDRVPVRLHVATGVVGVEIENVRSHPLPSYQSRLFRPKR